MEMKANKKLIQEELSAEMGKIILLKDLSNILSARNMLMEKYSKYTV